MSAIFKKPMVELVELVRTTDRTFGTTTGLFESMPNNAGTQGLVLTPGVWMIMQCINIVSGPAGITAWEIGVGTNNDTAAPNTGTFGNGRAFAATQTDSADLITTFTLTVSSTTTYYGKVSFTFPASPTIIYRGHIRALRLA